MKSFSNNNSLQKDLKELSVFLGNNLDWIQGAGGNTSVKDNGILWVKASGYWLSDAQKNNIFTPLNRKAVRVDFEDVGELTVTYVENKEFGFLINSNSCVSVSKM